MFACLHANMFCSLSRRFILCCFVTQISQMPQIFPELSPCLPHTPLACGFCPFYYICTWKNKEVKIFISANRACGASLTLKNVLTYLGSADLQSAAKENAFPFVVLGDYKSPGFNRSNLFLRRISNPPGRLTVYTPQ